MAEQLHQAVNSSSESPIIIDVRDPADYYQGHIDGAINLPLGSILESYQSLPPGQDLYLICYVGKKSQTAILALKYLGIENRLINVNGGMQEWLTNFPQETVSSAMTTEVISLNELKALIEQSSSVQIIDVRPAKDYRAGHLPGAISIPYNKLSSNLSRLKRDRLLVIYCSGSSCGYAINAARFIKDHGLNQVKVFKEGYPAWVKANLPIEKSF